MISVIIPYYNRSHTIQRCLNSVVNQTYQDFEIIIVDDASPDWDVGKDIIKDFNSSKITVIHHKENFNGSAARNTGLKNAKGEFVALLDSDDEWYPDHLENCMRIKNRIDTSNSLIFSSINIYYGNEHKPDKIISPEIKESIILDVGNFLFVEEKPIQTSTFFLQKEFALKNLFDESLVRFQDLDYVLQLSYNNSNIYQSPHIGAIVHWEGNVFKNSMKKGGTAEYAIKYSEDKEHYFDEKSKSRFLLKYSVLPLLFHWKISTAINIIKNYRINKNFKIYDILDIFLYMTIRRNQTTWNYIKKFKSKKKR